MAIPARKTRGRQKVAMVRMEKESNRLVTFSKRRSGLFKKASELCTLTGAEVVVVVFSPGRKVFSFGHPSVDTIINRFLGVDLVLSHARNGGQPVETDQPSDTVTNINKEITLLNNRLEVEKKHNEELVQLRKTKAKDSISWGLTSFEGLEVPHLKQLLGPLIELRDNLFRFGQMLSADEAKDANSSMPLARVQPMEPNNYFPLNMVVGQSSFGVRSSMLESPNDHPPMSMIPTSMPNSLGVGGYFDANVPYPFRFGGNLDGSLEPSLNMETNTKSFTSLLMGSKPMGAPNSPPSNIQGGFGFEPGFY